MAVLMPASRTIADEPATKPGNVLAEDDTFIQHDSGVLVEKRTHLMWAQAVC